MNQPFEHDDDDNRVIADMSGLEKRSLAENWFGLGGMRTRAKRRELEDPGKNAQQQKPNPYGNGELDAEGRRAAIWGAVSAALVVGLIYLVAFALFIAFLLYLWK